ncbi:MAG: hypothetical protein E7018_00360 [Alphaproteobacteria bacterium]|nr:hypothetical protein [Alphaproteobacteria bacterium]
MAKISLTASMRSNLLSLQKTNSLMDLTQERLSTGKKVNSAIDNPSSFYTARSLNNRANDLDALLDSMGQGIQTIKAATTAIETATSFLEQAKAVATQVLDGSGQSAAAGGGGNIPENDNDVGGAGGATPNPPTPDLGVVASVASIGELKAALADASIDTVIVTQSLTFADGETIEVGAGKTLQGATSDVTLTFSENVGVEQYAINLDETATIKNISVSITRQLNNIVEGGAITGGIVDGVVNVSVEGGATVGINNSRINGQVNVDVVGAYSVAVYNSIVNGTSNIYVGEDGVGLNASTLNGTANIIEEEGIAAINMATINGELNVVYGVNFSWSGSVINSSGVVNVYSAEASISGSDVDIKAGATIWVADNGSNIMQEHKVTTDANTDTLSAYATGNSKSAESFVNSIYQTVTNTQFMTLDVGGEETPADGYDISQYQKILNQYDDLIDDAKYKGVNLLKNETLKIKFNEDGSAFIDVVGKDISAANIGLTTTEWATVEDISRSIGELTSAINQLRAFAGELGNNYSIVMNRQDFTENLINILTEGADKLTLADMNEESANMLALQTRQQLAINALSLASQASQGVLKLF